jgi:hypothetical protein
LWAHGAKGGSQIGREAHEREAARGLGEDVQGHVAREHAHGGTQAGERAGVLVDAGWLGWLVGPLGLGDGPLSFHTPIMNLYEKYNDILIGSHIHFVHGAVCVKSIRVEQDIDREPLAFYTWCYTCKKYKSRM